MSTIGSLLYLVKLSRPDLENLDWKLSKAMDGSTPGQVKELCRLIFLLNNKKEMGIRKKSSHERQ
jgi:hypothetical protein